MPDIKRKC